jgi:hypothetical protein
MNYSPDAWVIVKVPSDDTHYRILAGWYGGYGGGDSWKLSSGVTKIEESDEMYAIHNTSGSIYNCHKNCERMSGYMSMIFSQYQKSSGIELVEFKDLDSNLFIK